MRPTVRRSFVIPLLAALAAACQQKPAETTAPPVAPPPAGTPAAVAPTLAQRLSSLVSGYWVSVAYLDEIARTRSPLTASAHFSNGPVTILIAPVPAATTDSTVAGLVYNFHEGSELTLFFRKGRTTESLPVRAMPGEAGKAAVELAYRLSSTDTTLYYVRYNPKNQRELSRLVYKRIAGAAAEKLLADKQPDESSLYYLLNRLLAAGTYTGTDSLHRPLRVQFLPNGRVTGLPLRSYRVQQDFLGGPAGVDILNFNPGQENQLDFAAQYGRDTLRLYTIREAMNPDSVLVLKPGRLVYQLVRAPKP